MDNSSSQVSFSTTPNAIFLPICAALVVAANYVPLLLLVRVKKLAACTLVIALAIQNTFTFVNAILWPNDNTAEWYSGVGLCDVQVAIRSALLTLLATSSACLAWDLAKALDTDNPCLHETQASRRRRIIIELLFCFVVPILQVALHYIVQASRFSVVTIYGCADYVDPSWPSVVILAIWPPVFALMNCYFAVLIIIRLRRHHGILSNTLSSTGSGLSARRFVKLFFLSGCILVVYLPVTLYYFYLNVDFPYIPYSWSRVHDPEVWNQIVFITTNLAPRVQYNGWVGIVMACFLVFLYSFGSEGKEIYKGWLVGCGLGKIFPSLLKPGELPMHMRGSSSRVSRTSRFDAVTMAIHYFDGIKNGVQGTSLAMTAGRKVSGARFEHADSPSRKSGSTSTTAGLISPSSPLSRKDMTPSPDISRPKPVHPAPLFTSPFRTHTNLPYMLFAPNDSAAPAALDTTTLPGRTRDTTAPLNPLGSVETTIWSKMISDDDLDPLAPRMGTRAYRERERRLHQEEETHRGVLPDTVTVDFGTSRTNKEEIKVERKLEIVEEVTPRQS